jgi:hypothetical protein
LPVAKTLAYCTASIEMKKVLFLLFLADVGLDIDALVQAIKVGDRIIWIHSGINIFEPLDSGKCRSSDEKIGQLGCQKSCE